MDAAAGASREIEVSTDRFDPVADTVAHALETPDLEQPYAALGVKDDEYARIREILGRRPTGAELAMYSVMWSEHCSYKSSKMHLKKFGELSQDTPRGPLLAGIGENAGVVDIGQGYAVTFKAESHNHPSFVEPYQGAATGVGGIVRDILAMGARPIGVMDSLRFGPLDEADTRRVLPGVVAGVGGYGNCLGLPNIGGEVQFHRTYLGNPLVNALCVGVLRHEDRVLQVPASALFIDTRKVAEETASDSGSPAAAAGQATGNGQPSGTDGAAGAAPKAQIRAGAQEGAQAGVQEGAQGSTAAAAQAGSLRYAVYRVENGRARLSPVKTGMRSATHVQVLDGLKEGDVVIVQPDDRVAEGVRIEGH